MTTRANRLADFRKRNAAFQHFMAQHYRMKHATSRAGHLRALRCCEGATNVYIDVLASVRRVGI